MNPFSTLPFPAADPDRSASEDGADLFLIAGPILAVPSWERDRSSRLSEYEKVLLSCRPSNPDALLAMLVPASFLTGNLRTRKDVATFWRTMLVLYLTDPVPHLHPSFRYAVVFFASRTSEHRSCVFFQVPRNVDVAEIDRDLANLLAGKSETRKFGYVLPDEPPVTDGLGFDRHHPAVSQLKMDIAQFGEAATIGDLFDLPGAAIHLAAHSEKLCPADQPNAVRVITGRDLLGDNTIGPVDEVGTSFQSTTVYAVVPPDRCLKPGDLLLRAIFRSTDRYMPVVEVTTDDLPLAASHTVIVLRRRDLPGMDARDWAITSRFLSSPTARRLIEAEQGDSVHLRPSELRRVRIPKVDDALRAAFTDLEDASIQFAAWRAEAEDILEAAIAEPRGQAMRARVIDTGRLLRLRHGAASLIGDPGFTVRTRYPYPVALRWRRAEAALSTDDHAHALNEVWEATEVLLCYLALVALALVGESNIELRIKSDLCTRLARGHGPTFGTWRTTLLQVAQSQAIGALPDGYPLSDLWRAVADPEFQHRAKFLNELRNRSAHLGGPDVTELPQVVAQAAIALRDLLSSVDFLADLTLVHVTAFDWDSLARNGKVSYRELVGDHPVVRTLHMSYDNPEVERGSLYLLDGERRLHLLRPYLTGQICHVCRSWSTYHIASGKDTTVILKTLEDGHEAEDNQIGDGSLREAFRQVGLL